VVGKCRAAVCGVTQPLRACGALAQVWTSLRLQGHSTGWLGVLLDSEHNQRQQPPQAPQLDGSARGDGIHVNGDVDGNGGGINGGGAAGVDGSVGGSVGGSGALGVDGGGVDDFDLARSSLGGALEGSKLANGVVGDVRSGGRSVDWRDEGEGEEEEAMNGSLVSLASAPVGRQALHSPRSAPHTIRSRRVLDYLARVSALSLPRSPMADPMPGHEEEEQHQQQQHQHQQHHPSLAHPHSSSPNDSLKSSHSNTLNGRGGGLLFSLAVGPSQPLTVARCFYELIGTCSHTH